MSPYIWGVKQKQPPKMNTQATTTTTVVAITGNTYPVKDQLKALGGRWNPDRKCWMVPEQNAAAAQGLVAGSVAPVSSGYNSPRTASWRSSAPGRYVRRECGCGKRGSDVYPDGTGEYVCQDCA